MCLRSVGSLPIDSKRSKLQRKQYWSSSGSLPAGWDSPGGQRYPGLNAVDWDDATKAAYAAEHTNGWGESSLATLRTYAEGLVTQDSE